MSVMLRMYFKLSLGGTSEAEPPVPIPNTVVKRLSADDTVLAGVWENRPLPGIYRVLGNGSPCPGTLCGFLGQ